MKKIFTLIVATAFLATAASAQTKFNMTIDSPAMNSTQTQGVAFAQQAYVTVTQGSVSPTDTVAYVDPLTPANMVNFLFVSTTKNMGDTIQFNRAGVVINQSGSTLDYCVSAFILENGTFAPTFDTSGATWGTCNTLNIDFATNVGDVIIEQQGQTSQKVNIFPNPATGNTINLDYIAQNASEVAVKVYDLSGRTVLSKSFGTAYKGQEGFSIDISSINSGMYILEVRQDGVKAAGRFVK